MDNGKVKPATIVKGDEYSRIFNRAVHRVQEENRKLGIPNVYSINGIIYYELPNGELSREDPYQENDDSQGPSATAPASGQKD